MLNLARTQVMGAYIPDANASEVTAAVAKKQEQKTIDPCPDLEYVEVTTRDELVAAAGDLSEDGYAKIRLAADIIYNSYNCLKVTAGTIVLDLNGHKLHGSDTVVHSYGEGTVIIINDLKGGGEIKGTDINNNYGVLQVKDGGHMVLNTGLITTSLEVKDVMFGVVAITEGSFQMNGGEIITNASAINTTNADIRIKGGYLRSNRTCVVYSDGDQAVQIYGNAHLDGGIVTKMGRTYICGDAILENTGYILGGKPYDEFDNLGTYCTYDESSGVGPTTIRSAIMAVSGLFGSEYYTGEDGNNDMSIVIEGNAKVSTSLGAPVIELLMPNTEYNQKVDMKLKRETYKLYDHDTLDTIYKEEEPDKSLKLEAFTTDLTVNGGIEK